MDKYEIGLTHQYGITIAMVIGVFAQNKKQLLSIISTNGKGEEDPHLSFLDKHKYKPFIGAIFFSILFMLVLMYTNTNKEEATVSNQNQEHNISDIEGLESSNEGFSGVANANAKDTAKVQQVDISKVFDINQTTQDNNYSDKNNLK